MSKPSNFLSTFSVTNFKAIRKSRTIRLSPFTAVIGNNGSGKSSLIEALLTYHTFVTDDLDRAFQLWRGMDHIRNKSARTTIKVSEDNRSSKPISFALRGKSFDKSFSVSNSINDRGKVNELFFEDEKGTVGDLKVERIKANRRNIQGESQMAGGRIPESESVFKDCRFFKDFIAGWQFIMLNPAIMGIPRAKTMTKGRVILNSDGSNIGEYLLEILNSPNGTEIIHGILESLQYVLPYAKDVQPAQTTELERTVYLQLTEQDFKVPGWLFSSGTLRILALLAVLRNPNPPSLVVIEELENGLDPRTIHLLIEEIMNATESGRTQVIATTHSPYLLDLLPLSTILFVERQDGREPVFSRPVDEKSKRKWAEQFGPGQLYTMNRLSKGTAQ
jgi:predicted ATPase